MFNQIQNFVRFHDNSDDNVVEIRKTIDKLRGVGDPPLLNIINYDDELPDFSSTIVPWASKGKNFTEYPIQSELAQSSSAYLPMLSQVLYAQYNKEKPLPVPIPVPVNKRTPLGQLKQQDFHSQDTPIGQLKQQDFHSQDTPIGHRRVPEQFIPVTPPNMIRRREHFVKQKRIGSNDFPRKLTVKTVEEQSEDTMNSMDEV